MVRISYEDDIVSTVFLLNKWSEYDLLIIILCIKD